MKWWERNQAKGRQEDHAEDHAEDGDLSAYIRRRIRNAPRLSEEERQYQSIERGTLATTLLLDTTFIQTYQELLDDAVDRMLSTMPREKEKREDAYMEAYGIMSVAQRLNHWRQTAQQIASEVQTEETETQSDST